jgi:two-component system sensor histidine kinase GlrK
MKLKIFHRLVIGYLIIFIWVMPVSVYAIFKLHQFNKGTRHILKIENSILSYKEKLTDSILSQLRYEKKYSITRDILFYNQFLSAKEEFNRYLTQILSIIDTPEKRISLNKIGENYKRFQSLVDKRIEYAQGNLSYPKNWHEQELGKVADEILEELKRLETYARADIQGRMGSLGDSADSALTFAVGMFAIAVLLVLATSFLITRSITKPITVLVDKTKEISQGVFEGDLEIASPPEMKELTGAFNSMCARLKAVDKMKSDFFSTMSHELRTPLTSIKEGTSLLLDGVGGGISDKQRKLLTILSEESHRLIKLVSSLLDLSKMEAGMMTYTFEQGDLRSLIERAMREMLPLVEAKKILIDSKVSENLPVLKIDRERMLQVLRNLIGNAVKFTPESGRVRIVAKPENRGVEVSVSDTGPGISPENLSTIFEKFNQGNSHSHSWTKGTGLGLAIVKHIITAHGGRVWAESKSAQGSSFIFVLPA